LRKLTKYKGKNPEMVVKLKDDFITGAMEYRKMTHKQALEIWETIVEPFEGYGFNKPHGIFYSLNGYHTAYYKHHFPACFMAAVLKSEVEKASTPTRDAKLRAYKREAERMGLTIKAPNVNASGTAFTVEDSKTLVTGLTAIKGVGATAVENILTTRKEHKFKSFADFLYRTNSRLIRKDVIQPLAKAGCFDSLNIYRKAAHDFYQEIRTKANKYGNENIRKGLDPWNCLNGLEFDKPEYKEEWAKKTILEGEAETLGEYLSGNINDVHDGFFTGKNIVPLSKLKTLPNGFTMRTEAIVMDVVQQKLKKGKNSGRTYGKCTISDINSDSASITIWPEQWNKYKAIFTIGKPVRLVCKVNEYQGNNSLVLERLET
jgi:DNA polymerase III subunit alpha